MPSETTEVVVGPGASLWYPRIVGAARLRRSARGLRSVLCRQHRGGGVHSDGARLLSGCPRLGSGRAKLDRRGVDGGPCVLVPYLLVSRRGLGRADLGIPKKAAVSPSQNVRIAAWALLGLIIGGALTQALVTRQPTEGFSYPSLTVNLFHAAQAGFLEELVVLAFVVTTLEQAGRPRGEIVGVALLLRASYHIYYGPGAIGVLFWGSMFLWLYFRFRTIVPLVVVHSIWDIFATLVHRWRSIAALEALLWLALFVFALVLWRHHRGRRRAGRTGAPSEWGADRPGLGTARFTERQRAVPGGPPPIIGEDRSSGPPGSLLYPSPPTVRLLRRFFRSPAPAGTDDRDLRPRSPSAP